MYIIITGASRGIGRELAKIYASHKYDLILTCKNNIDKLDKLKNELEYKFKNTIGSAKQYLFDEFGRMLYEVKS